MSVFVSNVGSWAFIAATRTKARIGWKSAMDHHFSAALEKRSATVHHRQESARQATKLVLYSNGAHRSLESEATTITRAQHKFFYSSTIKSLHCRMLFY